MGRWADRLRAEFLAAAQDLDEIGVPGEFSFFPDRTWHGYTYIPLSAPTANGNQLYGYVRFVAGTDGRDQSDFTAYADFTDETAERNPALAARPLRRGRRQLARRARTPSPR